MSLASSKTLKQAILDLPPTEDKMEGMKNLCGAIGKYMNDVQGGPLGSPGIFKLNETVMAAILAALPPVPDDSWAAGFAAAWLAGVLTATITPGTVTNPAWIGSGTKDVLTLPIGAAAIPTAAVGMILLMSALKDAKPDDEAPMAMADGIQKATKAFTFLTIGLGPPPVFPPIPIPTPAK